MADESGLFLSTLPAGPANRRGALAVVAVSAGIFLAAVPFAKERLPAVWAFIPVYESALIISDLITAVLLFGQFSILRARALPVLACAYLFTALITVVHALSYPGVFAPGGVIGGGLQTTVWLYMFWHAGFPLLVIAYALLKDDGHAPATVPPHRVRTVILSGIAAVVALVAVCTLIVTVGHDALPVVIGTIHYTPAMIFAISAVWGLSVVALVALWRRRPHSVLDVWLMVVMCAWLADVGLSAVFNGGRFDLGFYAGRIYGLAAASFVLMVLLLENGMLYARLIEAHARERREHLHAQQKAVELQAANKDLESFSYSVSHDLRAPLRAIDGFSQILLEDHAAELSDRGKEQVAVIRRNTQRMGQLINDLLEFSRLGRQPLTTREVQLDELVQRTIDELRTDLNGRRVEFAVGKLGVAAGDPALLKQVVTNLIGNAVKYTRNKDHAVVEVGCSDPAASGQKTYYVRDNGAGFDMRYADKLFGVFQRLHRAQEYEGTGVGLAIVRRVIDRHGGRIWADAKPGEGATFYFTLPAALPG